MEYNRFNAFRSFLARSPSEDKPWPLHNFPGQYKNALKKKLFDFFEECRLNFTLDNLRLNQMTASDLIEKLIHEKNEQFREEGNEIIHIPTGRVIDEIENHKLITILKIQLDYYDEAINYLGRYITAKTPDYVSFRAKIDKYRLEFVRERMIELKLISEDTELIKFIQVFKGQSPKDKIVWLKGPGLLHYFILKLNENGIEKIQSKWQTTANCFKKVDGNFEAEKLRGQKIPQNTAEVDRILKMFQING